MNAFGAFPENIVIKIFEFRFHFVANIGKMVIEIICGNVTSIYWFIFYLFIYSSICMTIIEIDILSLLDNTRYFIP